MIKKAPILLIVSILLFGCGNMKTKYQEIYDYDAIVKDKYGNNIKLEEAEGIKCPNNVDMYELLISSGMSETDLIKDKISNNNEIIVLSYDFAPNGIKDEQECVIIGNDLVFCTYDQPEDDITELLKQVQYGSVLVQFYSVSGEAKHIEYNDKSKYKNEIIYWEIEEIQ